MDEKEKKEIENIEEKESINIDVSVEEEETIKSEKKFIEKIKTMSKKKKIIFGSIMVVIIALVIVGVIFGSTIITYANIIFKRKITTQEFTDILGQYTEYETMNIMMYMEDADMEDAVVSQKGYDVSIEFYDFIDDQAAQDNYLELKQLMEEAVAESEDSSIQCFELLDSAYMEITLDGEYAVLSKVGDTFIFGVSYVENKEELDEVLDACGY